MSKFHIEVPVKPSKSQKEILGFIAVNRPRTKDIAQFIGTTLSHAEQMLCALKIAGKITQKDKNFPWTLQGPGPTIVPNVEDGLLIFRPVLGVKHKKATDEDLLAFINQYKPLTADVAAWLCVDFPSAAQRLRRLCQEGHIIRLRVKSPWRLRLKDEDLASGCCETASIEVEGSGRLKFSEDASGQIVISVINDDSKAPMTDRETEAMVNVLFPPQT